MSDESKAKRATVPLWVKLLLGLSLALNLAIAGLVFGVLSRLSERLPARGPVSYSVPYVLALPQPERHAMIRSLRREVRNTKDQSSPRGLQRQMLDVLRADTWDAEAARRILDDQKRSGDEFHTVMNAAWLRQMEAYSPEERRLYADRLSDTLRRGRGHKRTP